MVHFQADVVGTYLADKHRILKTGGCALFHHSNYTEHRERSCGQNPHAHVYMTPAVFTSPTNGARLVILRTARATGAGCIGEVHLVSAMTFGYERGVEVGFRKGRRTGGVAGFSRKRKKPETESQAFDSTIRSGRHANSSSPPSHGGDARRIVATIIAGGISG
jgi:hypothetical protein